MVAAAPLWALGPSQSAPGIEVRGTVVDGVTGKPVQGVRVTLVSRAPLPQDSASNATLTDDDGVFVLSAPGAGQYSLQASRSSRAYGNYAADPFSGSPGWFAVSTRTSGIVIKLWSVPQLRGVVADENGQPLAGTTVLVAEIVTVGERKVVKSVRRTLSAANGVYALEVRPGRYIAAAVPRLRPAGPARAVQFYPGVTSAGAASPLELAKGQSMTLDFHLSRVPGVTVSGNLQIPGAFEGRDSVEMFNLSSELPSGFPIAAAQITKLGTFMFPPVPAGSYEIRFVRYPTHSSGSPVDGAVRDNDQVLLAERLAGVPEGQTWWAAERVDVSDRDVTVAMSVQPGVRVNGRMVFVGPGARPAPADLPTRAVNLRSVDHRFLRPFQAGSAAEDGTFQTVAVPPGRYVLGVPGPLGASQAYDGYQLESVRVDGREVAGLSFDLRSDADAVLTFSSQPTIVRGSVAGKPGQPRFVLIWPEDENLWSGRGTKLGRVAVARTTDGTYSIAVFPGSYHVVAQDGVPPTEWESSGYLRSLAGVAERVTVLRGQTITRSLSLAKLR